MRGPYQSPGKRTQCAVLGFPFSQLSTIEKKNGKSETINQRIVRMLNNLRGTCICFHMRKASASVPSTHKDNKSATDEGKQVQHRHVKETI